MFLFSKLLSAITQPMFWLALWWALALLILTRWRRPAVIMLWSGLVMLGLLGFRAIPDALLRPLESRYPVPTAEAVDRHVGIIVLGGALQHPDSFAAHGQVPLGEAAERMTVPVGLMREHPSLELVFSGGEGRLLTTGVTDVTDRRNGARDVRRNGASIWCLNRAPEGGEEGAYFAAFAGAGLAEIGKVLGVR